MINHKNKNNNKSEAEVFVIPCTGWDKEYNSETSRSSKKPTYQDI